MRRNKVARQGRYGKRIIHNADTWRIRDDGHVWSVEVRARRKLRQAMVEVV